MKYTHIEGRGNVFGTEKEDINSGVRLGSGFLCVQIRAIISC